MVQHGNPFIGRYLRYAVLLLVFGLFLPITFFSADPLFAVLSITIALLFTVGVDVMMYQIVRYKANTVLKEDIQASVPAVLTRSDWRGRLIFTENYIVFVPYFHKITFARRWQKVFAFDMEGGYLELLYTKSKQRRVIHFIVASPYKVREELAGRTKEERVAVDVQ
ncbi:hypothetical protein ACFO4L_07530 [Bacillus daqingensis]|uniref:PH domain-containing protein n=1 Tax=Bacillus daqingensis TaxID=872396 RepID=A0ABV9NWT4_9BACI